MVLILEWLLNGPCAETSVGRLQFIRERGDLLDGRGEFLCSL